MMSKRIKINFDTINGSNYSIISKKDIFESNQKISKEMKLIVREQMIKQHLSELYIKNKIIT